MPAIIEPAATRAVAVRARQAIRLIADAASDWYARTNAGTSGSWTAAFASNTDTAIFVTAATVTNRFTFDDVQIAVTAPGAGAPATNYTGGLRLNLCEGPPTVLQVSPALDADMGAPPARPDGSGQDDPPFGLPLLMPPASRTAMGTALLETVRSPGGPADAASLGGQGAFTDVVGNLGIRTPIARVSGLGPFPAAASFYHTYFYFNHDFGRSRALGLTRVLYEEPAGSVAVVRGDGRRNTYRYFSYDSGTSTKTYQGAASLQNALTRVGTDVYKEVTPAGTLFYYEYDTPRALGKLAIVVDRYGNPVYYRYDANTRLQKIIGLPGASGLVPYLMYDGNGLCSALVLEDPADAAQNRTTYFTYDGDRNLLRAIGPELCITYYEYTLPAFVSAIHDPEGFRSYFAYDAGGRIERVIDPLGKASYFAYDTSTSPLTTVKDRAGKSTYFMFNAFASPTRVCSPGTPADYYTYDGEGNLTSSKNRLGNQWTYEYDSGANRISSTDPLGARWYFAYDSDDLLRKSIDPLGRLMYFDYDGNRNRTAAVDPLNKTTYYGYQASGLLHYKKDRRGNFTYWEFDAKANNTAVSNALAQRTYFAHNSAGERTLAQDARLNATYFAFDKRGRVTEVKDAYLNPRKLAYDGRCNLVQETDQRDVTTYHTYDGNSNRNKTVLHMGGSEFLAAYFRYDEEERLAGQTDARLNETYWTYDTLGRRQKQVDALGNETYWAYDAAHEVERALMPAQTAGGARAFTCYAYDSVGRQRQVIDAAMLLTYHSFDLAGNVRFTNVDQGWGRQPWGSSPYGGERATTYFEYDANDRRARLTDALGSKTYFGFDDEGNTERVVNPRGFATYYSYDVLNRKTHVKDGVHFAQAYMGYDAVGNVVRRIDQLSFESYFTFDKLNRRESMAGPFGATGSVDAYTYYAYDASSNRTETRVENPRGSDRRSSYYDYDNANRAIRMIDPEAATGVARGFMYYEYDRVGNQTKSVDQEGRPTYVRYDALNREDARWNAFLDTSYLHYDGRSAVTKRVDPEGRTTYSEYDLPGRVFKAWNSLGETSYFLYDARGQRTHAITPRGNHTYFRFDKLGRQSHEIDALGGVRYWGHDEVGNRVRAVDELGQATYLTYDGLNRLSKSKDQAGGETYMGYDARSSLKLRVDADGRSTYMVFDGAQRALEATFTAPAPETADATLKWGYDTVGNVTETLEGTGASDYSYDKLNRITRKRTIAGGVYYEYDRSGLKTKLRDPTLDPTYYVHDAAGRLVRVEISNARAAYYLYDRSDLLTRRALPGDTVLQYFSYDAAGRVQQLTNAYYRADIAPTLGLLAYYHYNRNAAGLEEVLKRAGNVHVYYGYDALDRITGEVWKTGSTPLNGFTYQYDAASNRTRKTDAASGVTSYYSYDSRNLLAREFILPTEPTSYFAHDAAQRMTTQFSSVEATYFTHNQREMITRLGFADSTPARLFAYNAVGERIVTIDDPSVPPQPAYWAYDGDLLISESDASNVVFAYYKHNEGPRLPAGRAAAIEASGSLLEVKARIGASEKIVQPVGDTSGSVEAWKFSSPLTDAYSYSRFGETLSGAIDEEKLRPRFMNLSSPRLKLDRDFYLRSSGGLYLPSRGVSTLRGARFEHVPLTITPLHSAPRIPWPPIEWPWPPVDIPWPTWPPSEFPWPSWWPWQGDDLPIPPPITPLGGGNAASTPTPCGEEVTAYEAVRILLILEFDHRPDCKENRVGNQINEIDVSKGDKPISLSIWDIISPDAARGASKQIPYNVASLAPRRLRDCDTVPGKDCKATGKLVDRNEAFLDQDAHRFNAGTCSSIYVFYDWLGWETAQGCTYP